MRPGYALVLEPNGYPIGINSTGKGSSKEECLQVYLLFHSIGKVKE